jgi:hypothetical protein
MSRPFIPAPNCASIEFIFSSNAELVENTLHVQKGSPYSLSDLQSLRGTCNTWDSATGFQMRSTAVTLVRIRTRALDTASSPVEDFSLPTPRAGSQGGTLFPNNVTFCFKLPTGHAGRSFRGRWYMVGLTTAGIGVDANHLGAVAASVFQGYLNTLITNLASAGHTVVVVSYRADKAWRTTALATTALPFVYVDTAYDSQRRRLTGRGHP